MSRQKKGFRLDPCPVMPVWPWSAEVERWEASQLGRPERQDRAACRDATSGKARLSAAKDRTFKTIRPNQRTTYGVEPTNGDGCCGSVGFA